MSEMDASGASWWDSSVVDWNAVGAIGTWVVGGAAAWLASRANAIAKSLRRTEVQREDRATRAMAIALRMEALHYGRRVKRLAEALSVEARSDRPRAGRAAAALEMCEQVGLSELGHRFDLVSNLPAGLAEKISILHAGERTARAVFRNNALLMRRYEATGHEPSKLGPVMHALAANVDDNARQVLDAVNALGQYLGLPVLDSLDV